MVKEKKDKEADDRKHTDPKPKSNGKFVFSNGDIYDGEYELNHSGSIERSGMGTLTCKDGSIYTGIWSADKMNGKGQFSHPSGSKYEGEFKNGMFQGVGIYYWPDGSSYEGEFNECKLQGKGSFKDPNGQTWVGKFQGDSAARLKFHLKM